MNGKTTNQRAKAGQGKTPYGLTAKQREQLFRISQNAEVKALGQYSALTQFTEIYIGHARDLAREGKKDAARNWYRYFDNARILQILASQNATCERLAKLRAELGQLKGECHPLDVPSWETEMQQIRHLLEVIANNLPVEKSAQTPDVSKRRAAVSLTAPATFSRRQAKRLVQKY